jgi:hypothetical protein
MQQDTTNFRSQIFVHFITEDEVKAGHGTSLVKVKLQVQFPEA